METPPYALTLRAALSGLNVRVVAVYGLGVVAQNVLQILNAFTVVGLMDKDPANGGKTIYGKPVLTEQEVVERGVQAIVIAATDIYWNTIAARLASFCGKAGIHIVFLNGTLADDAQEEPDPLGIVQGTRTSLEGEISKHEVISFDLFETLVTRLASRPDDILERAIARTKADLKVNGDLLAVRKEAEAACCTLYGRYRFSLADVYEWMAEHRGLAPEVTVALHKAELAAEIRLAAPRQTMIDLLAQALASRKKVCIVTDTHLSRETITSILERCGVPEVSNIFISCETGASKFSGELFDQVKDYFPTKRILHIGDNAEADGVRPRQRGLSAFPILSPGVMLAHSRLRELLVPARTAQDGLLLGILAHALFDDPFTPVKERVRIDALRQFGYVFLGPLLLVWMAWLIAQLRKNKADKLLFLAREGYFLTRIYNSLRATNHLNDLPEGIYFPASRRMASVASLRTPQDAAALLRDEFSGPSCQLLQLRYGVTSASAAQDGVVTNSDPESLALIEAHMDSILANAADERRCYLAFMATLGVTPQTRVAVADLGIKGTIQHALQVVLEREISGYYITGFFGNVNPYGMHTNTAALFPQVQGEASSQIYRYHHLCESVLVAPEGMYVRATADGTFVHAARQQNQRLFDKKEEIFAGIRSFLESWPLMEEAVEQLQISPELVDALFGMAMSHKIDIDESIKATMYVDENYRAESEKRIWD
jgi:FMN phosphatase YigB (HAD superfamily)